MIKFFNKGYVQFILFNIAFFSLALYHKSDNLQVTFETIQKFLLAISIGILAYTHGYEDRWCDETEERTDIVHKRVVNEIQQLREENKRLKESI